MVIDIPQERGMSNVEFRFGQDYCYFPLFNFLKPLPLQWMMIVYGVMWLGRTVASQEMKTGLFQYCN